MKNKIIMTIKNIGKILYRVLVPIICVVLVIIFSLLCYVRKTWPDISYAELMYHMNTTFSGTNLDLVYSALLKYGVPTVVVLVVGGIIFYYLYKKKRNIFHIVVPVTILCMLVLDTYSAYLFNKKTDVISDWYNSYFTNNESDFIENIYVNPENVSFTFPEKKRNLIYIYMESMEMSYTDEENGGDFEDNYIPNLTKLAETYDDFSGTESILDGGASLPGTNWTAAAIFAQTSSLPLDLPVHEGAITNPEQFFPALVTLGDILEDQGYVNIIEMGSSAGFGGKSAYLKKHGNFEIRDYDYAINNGYISSDYNESWGYEDEKLFEFAKKELTELSKSGQPFNYSLLTADTHCGGYVCRLCDTEFGDNENEVNKYKNIIACSDRQVADFVEWIQQQDFYENTTIVLTGDHTTMEAELIEVMGDCPRKTYTCIINSAADIQMNTYRKYATIDLYPTTLAALGVEMSSDRVGCGTNLYGTLPTIIEEYGQDVCEEEFSKSSRFVESFVKFNVDEETLKAAQDSSYLEVAEENGGTRFRLLQADNISCSDIRELRLVIHNKKTDEVIEYNLDPEEKRSGWQGIIHSDFPFSEIENVEAEIYITVGDYKNYLFKTVPTEDLGMWNINWDNE